MNKYKEGEFRVLQLTTINSGYYVLDTCFGK